MKKQLLLLALLLCLTMLVSALPSLVLAEETSDENQMMEIPEETTASEEAATEPEEETVECIDEGDQSLAEYKPQIGGQPNPFENDTPTEIDDRPVEDYIGEGEDRPGEGKHF